MILKNTPKMETFYIMYYVLFNIILKPKEAQDTHWNKTVWFEEVLNNISENAFCTLFRMSKDKFYCISNQVFLENKLITVLH